MEKVSFAVTIIKNTNVHTMTFEFMDRESAIAGFKEILMLGIREFDIESGLHTLYLPSQITKVTTSCADLFAD